MTLEEASVAALGIYLRADYKRRLEAAFMASLPRITEWAQKELQAARIRNAR